MNRVTIRAGAALLLAVAIAGGRLRRPSRPCSIRAGRCRPIPTWRRRSRRRHGVLLRVRQPRLFARRRPVLRPDRIRLRGLAGTGDRQPRATGPARKTRCSGGPPAADDSTRAAHRASLRASKRSFPSSQGGDDDVPDRIQIDGGRDGGSLRVRRRRDEAPARPRPPRPSQQTKLACPACHVMPPTRTSSPTAASSSARPASRRGPRPATPPRSLQRPQFHTLPIGVCVQHGPKPPPFQRPRYHPGQPYQ